MFNSLFGEEFDITIPEKSVKDLVKKANTVKEKTPEQILKSKKITLDERLSVINSNVLRVLGKQRSNVIVIKDKATFENYVTNAINVSRIAIDTETNNSLDPVTCKLMGACLYFPGGKQAYIPINHRNPKTKERLSWQLTEEDCYEQFQRINNSNILQIYHNAKFDYEVIKCTCNIEMKPGWDTMVAARLLNENEPAGLKWQYINKIDKSQEKYDIENLFENVSYADVDPDIFALYAATDSMMTDRLFEIQKVEFDKEEYGPHLDMTGTKTLPGLRWVFHEVEMPIVVITAEMELTGVCVDEEFGARLKEKYTGQLTILDTKINEVLKAIEPIIETWRIAPENAARTKTYVPKKTKMTREKIEQQYPEVDKDGNRFKFGKSKVEQLDENINLSSPSQLAILFYDILSVEDGEKNDRKTGKDELKAIKEKLAAYLPKMEELDTEFSDEDLTEEVEEAIQRTDDEMKEIKWGFAANLAELLLKRRELTKLITTYIDVIPDLVKHWPDHRIRFHLNALGTDTGRYSSGGKLKFMENDEPITVSGINIQNIPSKGAGRITRLLFEAAETKQQVEETDNIFTINEFDEVETTEGWKYPIDIKVGDILIGEDNQDTVRHIEKRQKTYCIYV